jgi:hypothetical protein
MASASSALSADLLARVRAEIDARIGELRPALEEYRELLDAAEKLDRETVSKPKDHVVPTRRRGPRGSAAGALELAASGSRKAAGSRKRAVPKPPAAPKSAPARRGAAEQAIVAALEHGSHTVSELVLVTAMSGAEIRAGAKKLQRAGVIGPTRREGRTAYALSVPATED